MAKITVVEVTNKNVWEKFVLSFSEANFLQSFNWGEFHQKMGKVVKRVGFYQEEKLIGVMLCIKEKAKRANYLTIPGGPLINWDNKTHVRAFRKTVEDLARGEMCSFVRVRSQLFENETNSELFKKLGFKNAPMHLHAELTRQLDLQKEEEQLLAEMRKTTRYEIKQAIKMGIKIKTSQDPDDINDFYRFKKILPKDKAL